MEGVFLLVHLNLFKEFIMRRFTYLAVASLLGFGMSATAQEGEMLSITPISDERKVEVTLDLERNHFSIQGGCNSFMGSVQIDEAGNFIMERDRVAMTMMACPGELQRLDERILSFMEQTPKVVQQGEALYLVSIVEGEENSHYLPITLDRGSYKGIEARPYELTFLYISHERVPCELAEEEGAKCLQARVEKEDAWEIFTDEIIGFEPYEGVEYRLRLKEYTDEREDAPRLVLDMIVEQALVEDDSAE